MRTTTVGVSTQSKTSFLNRWSDVKKNFKEDTWSFALISALIFMLFAIYVGEQIVAISVAGIVSGSIGLSASPMCGNWDYDPYNLTGDEGFLYPSMEGAAQQRSTSYVDNCYVEAAIAEGCNLYYNRTISYSEEHNASCPFFGDVCLYGQTSAYALDTGFVDSNVLGINAAKRYQFRRRTTCSPIVTNSSYITYYYPREGYDLPVLSAYFYGYNETYTLSFKQPIDFPFAHTDYLHSHGYHH